MILFVMSYAHHAYRIQYSTVSYVLNFKLSMHMYITGAGDIYIFKNKQIF